MGITMHAAPLTQRERVRTGGLNHLAINVADLDRSIKFYTDMFNMEVLRQNKEMAFLHTGGTHDSLVLFKASGPVTPSGVAHFGFAVDDVNFERAKNYIHSNNIPTVSEERTITDRFLFFRDPDGYVIQVSTI